MSNKFLYDLSVGILSGVISGLIVAYILSNEIKKHIKEFRIRAIVFLQMLAVIIFLIFTLFFLSRNIKLEENNATYQLWHGNNSIHYVGDPTVDVRSK